MLAWQIDAFADNRHGGNPAAVHLGASFPTEKEMQDAARDFGLPTTAFLVPVKEATYRVRWFTVEQELDLCGHATVASACYLYNFAGIRSNQEVCFLSKSGPLYARIKGNRIFLNLPRVNVSSCEAPASLEQALGTAIHHCAKATDDFLVEVASEQEIVALKPDFRGLKDIKCRGFAVTARGNAYDVDFVSRFFGPAVGVDEDEVCVSAHCKLGPYWAEKLERHRLSAVQLSPRGGRLIVKVTEDRVHVGGTARLQGTISTMHSADQRRFSKEVVSTSFVSADSHWRSDAQGR